MNVKVIRPPRPNRITRGEIPSGEAFFYQDALRIAVTLPECLDSNPNNMWAMDPSTGRLTFLDPSSGVIPASSADITVEAPNA